MGRAKRSRSWSDRAYMGWGTEVRTVVRGRRCRIRKWGAPIRTVGGREGVGVCQNGIRGRKVDVIFGLGIQLYTTISYANFG